MNDQDASLALLLSVRYALGRRSYIVADVCDMVLRNEPSLTANDRIVMSRDISMKLERAREVGGTLGDQYDHDMWVNLLELLGRHT